MASTDRTARPAFDASAKTRLLRDAAASAPLWIVAQGQSMGRTIPNGASVLVAPYSTPRRGQVWAYCEQSGAVVVHRYRRHDDEGHVLQGDARLHPDPPVRGELLIGNVTAVRDGSRVRPLGWRDRVEGESRRVTRALVARAARMTRRLRHDP